MAKKTKSKKGNYSEKKNSENPVKIVEKVEEIPGGQLFPQTMQIVPVKEFDRPLVKLEEAVAAWGQYQSLINALIKSNDIVIIQGIKKAKKSGINKIARFFGYSCEIIRAYKEEIEGPQGGKHFVWRVWAKAIAPTGRFRVSGAACSSNERRFVHLEHDVYSVAETRSKKRAIEELAGMGELELMEEEKEKNEKPEKKTYKPKPNEDKETIDLSTGEVGVNPNSWKPMYKAKYGKGYPTNDKMSGSPQQLKVITEALKRAEIEPTEVIFVLNNRADRIPREKMLIDCDKGDCFDIISAIMKSKEEFLKLIKKEEPPEEEVN